MFEKRSLLVFQRTVVTLAAFVILLVGCQPAATPTATPLPPDVTLVVNPDIADVSAGDTVALTAETSGRNLRFKWSVSRGILSAFDTPSVLYTAPDTEGVDTVTVEVSSASGTTVESVSFNVIVPAVASPPDIDPAATSACPTADAEGTVSPAIAIYSVTFAVNSVDQVVDDSNSLRASPGDQVQVIEVTICPAEPFAGSGGNVYVEFDPVDQSGRVIASEVKGTQGVGVSSGFTPIPGPDYTWTIGENWRHISVVTVHYPAGGGTQNPQCENGTCEADDRIIVGW